MNRKTKKEEENEVYVSLLVLNFKVN